MWGVDSVRVIRVISLLMVFLLLTHPVLSRPEYMRSFKEFSDDIKKCTLCHVQSSGYGGLNPFGADFAKVKSLTPELMQLDSDSDKFSNIEEMKAGTMPGDPGSYPGRKTPDFTLGIAIIGLVVAALLTTRKT